MTPAPFERIQDAIESRSIKAVVIGASAGAIEALSVILPSVPSNSSLSILIVVHIPPDRESVLTQLFARKCTATVREVEDKLQIEPATIYFAPPDYHLLVEEGRYFSLSVDDPVLYSRPSIDVLFESAADTYGSSLLGIILTGANSDGAKGLRAVHDLGGFTIVQQPDQAEISTMPQAALTACPDALPLTLQQIASLMRSSTK